MRIIKPSNRLKVKAYTSAGVEVEVPELKRVDGLTFDTFYPGGVFGSSVFTVKRKSTRVSNLAAHQMIRITNGLETVYEGEIIRMPYLPGVGNSVECVGYWAGIMEGRGWRKPWADTRTDQNIWELYTSRTYSSPDKFNIEREGVDIRMVPKDQAFTNAANQTAAVFRTVPTGQTIKRITFTYTLAEGAQNWQVEIVAGGSTVWSSSTSGTVAVDWTLATPNQTVYLVFRSNANQTAPADGSIFGMFSNVVVMTETADPTVTTLAKGIRAHETDLSATETQIATNAYTLIPFVSEGENLADCLLRACGYGDGAGAAWVPSIVESALGTDGKPVLSVQAELPLTAYDVALRLDENNVELGVEFTPDISEVENWIEVIYTNVNGREIHITPDDDATLKDDASILLCGERHAEKGAGITVDTTSQTAAIAYGVRYLAQHKDPQWQASSGIPVKGYIRTATSVIPACRIRAGMRLKVENFLEDLNVSGLTLMITATSYDAATEINTLTVGVPDWMSVENARMERSK